MLHGKAKGLGSRISPHLEKKEMLMEQDKTRDESRREFLIKAGKLAVYTPPALMLLMHPSKTIACTSAGGKRPLTHSNYRPRVSEGRSKFDSAEFKFGGFNSKYEPRKPKMGGIKHRSGHQDRRS
jgi:hypothetical protein